MTVTIKYYNNTVREVIGEIEYRSDSVTLFWESIIKMLLAKNHFYDKSKGRFYSRSINGNLINTEPYMPIGKEDEIIYSETIIPCNAYRFKNSDGIDYIFHTNERNHMFDPHVHAIYDNKDMFISLNSDKTIGTLGNKHKESIAKRYVYDNREAFLEKWNELQES